MTDAMQVELSCEAGHSETVLEFRQETAAKARTRKAKQRQLLQDEAAAWRELARQMEAAMWQSFLCWYLHPTFRDRNSGQYAALGLSDELRGRLFDRLRPHLTFTSHHLPDALHTTVHPFDYPSPPKGEDPDHQHNGTRALLCLFLALEAEDELKALTPVSRPSSLRRPRQHTRGK